MSSKCRVVVIVPMFRAALRPYERQSIESLRTHLLGNYDVTIVTQQSALSEIRESPLCNGIRTELFSARFATYQGFNRLMLSHEFFLRFMDYSHMLIFQTDCLALHGDVSHWIDADIDYVGAPWVEKDPASGGLKILGVGNGGLSLRKIRSAIEVLRCFASTKQRLVVAAKFALPTIPVLWHKCFLGRFWPRYHIGSRNEDVFWSQVAPLIAPWYRVADYASALSFAFEREPLLCFEASGRKLPLGLHAFHRHADDFLSRVAAGR